MDPLIQCKTTIVPLFVAGVLACFALLPKAKAVVPPPDGGYPGFNTAEGQNSLFSLTTGVGNAAVGWYSLFSNTDGSFNTALGAGTLTFNVGNQNTGEGIGNIAIGTATLLNNTTGSYNTANGMQALFSNTTGFFNTATGPFALLSNTEGGSNTAVGDSALVVTTTGIGNTAIGAGALAASHGNGNTAVGANAGQNVNTANNVIAIGSPGADVSDTCFIGNIFGVTSASGTAVFINQFGQLGTTTSSGRFKEQIKPMERASETLFALKPVTFHYKKAIDPQGIPQFGLVAEDVEAVNPDLVVRDKEGKVSTVRYDAVNAMLLNEFLKEHRRVQELESTVAKQEAAIADQHRSFQRKLTQQETQIEALTSGLEKVSAQIEMMKPATQIVVNEP